jgi:hypothetical protein
MSGKFKRANSQIECCLFILKEVSTPERLQYTSHDRPRFRNGSPVPGHLLLMRRVGKSLYWTNMWRLRHNASSRRLHQSTVRRTLTTSMHLPKIPDFRGGTAEGCCENGNERANSTRVGNIFNSCISLRRPGFNPRLVFGTVVDKVPTWQVLSEHTNPPPSPLQLRSNGVPTMYNVSNWQRRWTRLNLSGWTTVRSKGSSLQSQQFFYAVRFYCNMFRLM